MSHWVEVLLVEPPGVDGYPSVVGVFRLAQTNGNSDTAEDIERRYLAIALEDMRKIEPGLYAVIERWRRDHDSTIAQEAFEWLERRIDQLLS